MFKVRMFLFILLLVLTPVSLLEKAGALRFGSGDAQNAVNSRSPYFSEIRQGRGELPTISPSNGEDREKKTAAQATINLGFPFQSGFWVPTTYDGHGGAGTYNAVDFRYASPQVAMEYDWTPKTNQPLIPPQSIIATHNGFLTLIRERFYCGLGDEVVQSSLRITDLSNEFATHSSHLETVKLGDWVVVYNAGESGVTLRPCANTSCTPATLMPNGSLMKIEGGPQRAENYTWWFLRGDFNNDSVLDQGWAIEAVNADGKQVLLNSLVHVNDIVFVQNGGLNLRDGPCVNSSECRVIDILASGTELRVIDGPRRRDDFTWWRVQRVTGNQQPGWVAEALNDPPPSLSNNVASSVPTLGKRIAQGAVLGAVSNYGCARSGAHLHFMVFRQGVQSLKADGPVRLNGEVIFELPNDERSVNGRIAYPAMPRRSTPTLSASLTASPASGTAPLNTNLRAEVSGTATGTINYTFWWDCNSASNNVGEASSACGDPRDPIRGAKFDGVSDNPKAVTHVYSSPGNYTAKVIVERGTARAEQRISIGVTGASCNYSIDPSSRQFGSNGGSGSVSVTAPNDCSWNASSNANWITINSGNNGSGNGQVGYTVQPNSGQGQRTGAITVAGQAHTITQQGVSCNYSIDPPSRQFDSNGGSGNVSVIAPSGCSWTATSNANWIAVTSGSSGNGNGAVTYFVATNSGTARTGTITVAGQTFAVMQGAACSSNCPATFTEVSTSLTSVSNSFVAWGDYDNDGDLDILLTGQTNTGQRIAKIYRNDGGGVFTDILAALTAVLGAGESLSAWGDYDNDGDLDILLTGSGSGDLPVTKIYRNDNGNFVDINASLTPVRNSSVAWGDYDNDGDLDILSTGATGSGSVSKIYRNDGGGSFIDINAPLPGVAGGCVSWADYDSDGDLDILLTGNSGSAPISKIYRNEGNGAFSDINASLPGIVSGSAAWGDYDNDGDLDILLTGISSAGPIAGVYRNDSGVFMNIPASLRVAEFSSAAWGDYDNDGDLDILLAGAS